MTDILAADQVSFRYSRNEVINELSMQVSAGDLVGIIGPNGSGKTTLIRLLSGLLKPTTGKVRYKDVELHRYKRTQMAREMALVPQASETNFAFTAGDVVLMGRYAHKEHRMFESDEDIDACEKAMGLTDTVAFARRLYNELSGGEQQRVMIASALAQAPNLLFLDEPTASLDIKYQSQVLGILHDLNQSKGLTVVMAMHDLNLAALFCKRLIMIKHGRIVSSGTPSEVLQVDHLREVYEVDVQAIRTEKNGHSFIFPKLSSNGRSRY